MAELIFCDKCGDLPTEGCFRAGVLCLKCLDGHYVSTGLEQCVAEKHVIDEYKAQYGIEPNREQINILLKQTYFDHKLDKNLSKKAIKKREKFDSSENQAKLKKMQNIVPLDVSGALKCPGCGSTDLKEFGTSKKFLKIIFGGKHNKSFKCNKCGYTW